jgi:23S rRNA U2552 (ribose-2'-O)-methylase RlmE/FtsJ
MIIERTLQKSSPLPQEGTFVADCTVANDRNGRSFIAALRRFLGEVRKSFASVRLHAPKASRSCSSEIYIVAKGFKGGPEEGDALAEESERQENA